MACNVAAAAVLPNTILCLFWISISLISGSTQLSVEKERKALLNVRTGLSVAHGELSSWSSDDCSKWERVQCHNITSHVVKLDLSNLGGPKPIKNEVISSLLDLEHLTYLDLSWNNFGGAPIPAFLGSLTQLEHLDLSRGGFSGRIPHHLGNLSKLLHLALNDNNIDGEIPETIIHLRNLQFLDLSYNSIIGQIPESIGNLRNLKVFILSFNNIEGAIPKSIGNLSKMSVLDLSDNRIFGAIPGTALQNLNLSGDKITGQVPNSFSGSISESLAAGDDVLSTVILSNNRLSGKIPPTLICKASLNIVNLSNNSLSGELPDCWNNSASLWILDVSSNKLYGGIPVTLGRLTNLQSLHLNNNNFTGSIPSTLQRCREIVVIDLSLNKLSGGIPSWIGGSLLSLQVLSLRSNKLSGEIPWQLSLGPSLQVLDLADNNLSDYLPPSFGNFRSMATRQNGKELAQLDSSSFYYTETVTITVKGLQLFYTRTLSLVTSIDLSNNNIFGEIPEELTNLHSLRFLNLSRNHFSGNIPDKIGLMSQLESLDLSKNYLSGGIPSSISVLYSLSVLNLSYNNLIGRIPLGTQLQTFTNLSYMDNRWLCGEPLQIKCPGDNPPPIGALEEEDMREDDEYRGIWYFIGFAPGFVFGFWGFMGAVMIKRSTRIKYILLIDRICSWFVHM